MAGSSNDPGTMISGINVTPLVDVMLVLLIIFMVTAKLIVAPSMAVPLQLPKSSSGEATEVVLSISLLVDGSAAVNGQKVISDQAILELARKEHQAHPELKAVIQADRHVYHERVIQVMDLLAQANITQIAFGVASP